MFYFLAQTLFYPRIKGTGFWYPVIVFAEHIEDDYPPLTSINAPDRSISLYINRVPYLG